MKLEKEEFGVSSVHASLVMFINASIRLTIPAGENHGASPTGRSGRSLSHEPALMIRL
jgi:hypothetical protein